MGRSGSHRGKKRPPPSPSPPPSSSEAEGGLPVGGLGGAEGRGAARGERGPGKPGQARPPAASDSAGDEEDGEEGEEEAMSLEARAALLEVENETLKAENRELRKKLVELLRRSTSAAPAPPAKGKRRRHARSEPEKGGAGSNGCAERRNDSGRRQPPEDRSAAANEPLQDSPLRRRRAPAAADAPREPPAPREEEGRGGEAEGPNAVMLVNGAMEAYNEQITNNVPLEKRLPLVKEKLERFISSFDQKIQIFDLKSGGAIIKDRKMFTARYTCVFRESGTKLKGSCNKRFFYDSAGFHKATYSLDYETHEHLVTAMPGMPQDGNLGVREPRTEHLIVLYEEKGGKLTRMWLRPDIERLGMDPCAGEDILVRSEGYKAFEAKLSELRGGSVQPTIFHNYHNTPTLG